MHFYTDQINHSFQLAGAPKRILSVVPSQTELLYALGLDAEVIGITKFCVHPQQWFKYKQRVGGTKNLNRALIEQLQPNLIIANKEENTREDIEWLQQKFAVYTSNIITLADALSMIEDIGGITQKNDEAHKIITNIKSQFEVLAQQLVANTYPTKTVCYLIWQKPFMAVGGNTFINTMLHCCGLHNVFQNTERYPETTIEAIHKLNPDFIFLSSEPFPFKEKQQQELQQIFANSKVVLVDGEMFSWYGSRLLQAGQYFFRLMNKIVYNAD